MNPFQKQLRDARALMNNNGAHWIKGRLMRRIQGEECYCALGGICTAVGVARSQSEARFPKAAYPAAIILANAIRETQKQQGCRSISAVLSTIYSWNDDIHTTWRDVSTMLGRAARSPKKYLAMSPSVDELWEARRTSRVW